MNKENAEYQKEVCLIAEDILISRGIIQEGLSLEYKDEDWLISAEIDIEQMKRSKRMGDSRLWLRSIAISHSGYLVFNMGTRALVHNALIKTEDIWANSPTIIDWLSELELLRNSIYRQDTKDRLSYLNKILIDINESITSLTEITF